MALVLASPTHGSGPSTRTEQRGPLCLVALRAPGTASASRHLIHMQGKWQWLSLGRPRRVFWSSRAISV